MSVSNPLLVRTDASQPWRPPAQTRYPSEAQLRDLLADDPTRLPGIGAGALAVTEFSTSAGPIDVCVVEPDGTITVVECKLRSSSEARRTVIGQVQDYASAIWSAGPNAFIDAWRRHPSAPDIDQLEGSISTLRDNIAQARINLCLAVDEIDDNIRRLVEYLSRITRDDIAVTALSLAYAREGSVEILMPATYGAELAREKAGPKGVKALWTHDLLIESARASDRPALERILETVEQGLRGWTRGSIRYGLHPRGGIYLHPQGARYAPAWLWVDGQQRVVICGMWKWHTSLVEHPGFKTLAALLGQDLSESPSNHLIEALDIAELCDAIFQCASEINAPADIPTPAT
jgi:hypothetical protein